MKAFARMGMLGTPRGGERARGGPFLSKPVGRCPLTERSSDLGEEVEERVDTLPQLRLDLLSRALE